MQREFYTYIVTNPNRSDLYTGMTNNRPHRKVQHSLNIGYNETFAGKNFCYCLVWYETFSTANEAIQSDKYIKGKNRKWKEEFIAKTNT